MCGGADAHQIGKKGWLLSNILLCSGADARQIEKKGSAFFDILLCFDARAWHAKLICHCEKSQYLPEQGNVAIHNPLLAGEGELFNERSEFSNSGEVITCQYNRKIVPSPKNLTLHSRIDFSPLPLGEELQISPLHCQFRMEMEKLSAKNEPSTTSGEGELQNTLSKNDICSISFHIVILFSPMGRRTFPYPHRRGAVHAINY